MTDEEKAKAEIEAREKKIEELEATVNKLSSTVEGAEKLIQKWSNEVGDNRKLADDAKKVIDKIAELEKTISELKEKRGTDTKVSKSIEEELSAEQRELADKKFQELDAAERLKISKDPEERKKFFDALLEASPVIPTSLFGEKKAEPLSDGNRFRKLFGLADRENNALPSSRQSAPTIRNDDKNKNDGARRLMGGVMPRPENVTK